MARLNHSAKHCSSPLYTRRYVTSVFGPSYGTRIVSKAWSHSTAQHGLSLSAVLASCNSGAPSAVSAYLTDSVGPNAGPALAASTVTVVHQCALPSHHSSRVAVYVHSRQHSLITVARARPRRQCR